MGGAQGDAGVHGGRGHGRAPQALDPLDLIVEWSCQTCDLAGKYKVGWTYKHQAECRKRLAKRQEYLQARDALRRQQEAARGNRRGGRRGGRGGGR